MDERIAVLERRLRRVQVIGGVALVACLASSALAYFAPGKKSEGVVRAGAFVLVDERGATVATLASEPNGPLLRFRSKATESDLLVGGFGPNIGLFILDDRKQVRAMWAAGKKGGGPAMTFSDGRGRTRVMVGTEDDGDGGNPVLFMSDDQGRARIYSRVAREPVFVVRDEAGRSVWGYRAPDLPQRTDPRRSADK